MLPGLRGQLFGIYVRKGMLRFTSCVVKPSGVSNVRSLSETRVLLVGRVFIFCWGIG